MFERNRVLNKRELKARYEVLLAYYTNKIEIELLVIIDLSNTHIIPAAYKYVNELAHTAKNLEGLGLAEHTYTIKDLVKEICTLVDSMKDRMADVEKEIKKARAQKEAN